MTSRLVDPVRIELLCDLLITHGALGNAPVSGDDGSRFSEEERLAVVPLVFALLPRNALIRRRPDQLIKPLLADHLKRLGIPAKPPLLDVLKSVGDQYYATSKMGVKPRKMGISDLRAIPHKYRSIILRQNHRCAVCGLELDKHPGGTLDHRIPWRLLGDVPDGANWQILCSECNRGKLDYLSSLQAVEAENWIYRTSAREYKVSGRTRYVVLTRERACEVCGRGPKETRLQTVLSLTTALPVADLLSVRCEDHHEET